MKIVTMTKVFQIQNQHFGFCCLVFIFFWMTLCLSGCASQSDVNETRNGSISLLNDQATETEDRDDDDSKMGCIDWEGKPVADGENYVPNKNDMCMLCTCDRRFPIICHSVACSPPHDCTNLKVVPSACCEYECLDVSGGNATDSGNNPSSDDNESITNLSLRLIASTVTSLLFLALLLFMVHRLRQRRMLLAMRRFQARSGDICINDDFDSDRNIPDNFMSLECPPYTDPPPPYSPPKPPHILPGEQPPPYEEIGLGENRRRESRIGNGQEERNMNGGRVNQSENTSSSNNHILARTHNIENASDFRQSYLSHNPAFGVEMETLRHPAQSQSQNSPSSQTNILPAYASTDIVFRNATFSTMVTPPHRQFDASDNSTPSHPSGLVSGEHPSSDLGHFSSHVPSNPGMPTLTAFQRFSSLFKRDRSKWKGRAPQPRPVSECNPPHYATLSGSHNAGPQDRAASGCVPSVTYRNNSRRTRVKSCYPNLTLTDRMRLSYDSARAAYELAALSPSTSSSSSISVEQVQDGSVATSCIPPTSTTRSTEAVLQPVSHQSRECVYDLQQQHAQSSVDSVDLHSATSPVTCSSTLSPSSSGLTDSTYQPVNEFHPARFQPHSDVLTDKRVNDTRGGNNQRNLSTFSSDNPVCGQPYFNHYAGVLGVKEVNGESNTNSACGYYRNRNQNRDLSYSHSPERLRGETSQYGLSTTAEGIVASSGGTGALHSSPPPVVGQMRRSHSAISQVSAFSVCSETGEKKLKDRKLESDAKPLTADCQYPQRHSLSQSKHAPTSSKMPNHLHHPNNRIPPAVAKKTSTTVGTDPSRNNNNSVVTRQPPPFDPDLKPATLIVPVSSHPSLTGGGGGSSMGKNPGSNWKKDLRQEALSIEVPEDSAMLACVPPLVQSSPISPPFVTFQSGKLMSSHPMVEWPPVSRDVHAKDLMGKVGHEGNDESKKVRKKRDRDRRASLSLKPKIASSPVHSAKADVVKVKHDFVSVKKKPKSSTKGLSCHRTDKKRIQNFPQPCPTADNSLPNFDDNSTSYGNADVYRSQGCEPSFATTPYPVLLSSPFHKYVDNNTNAMHLPKECGPDTKRNHTSSTPKGGPECVGSSPFRHLHQAGHVAKDPSPQFRKKPSSHKRQPAAGNRNSHSLSQSQKHVRSKSLTDKLQVMKQREADGITPPDTAFEQVASGGRWVKSGFGHDLAFDDQLGDIDLGINLSSHRANERVGGFGVNPSQASKSSRAEGHFSNSVDQSHGPETAAVVPLPNRRRSGLSQDLSFVNRSEINPTAKRFSKRGSLPAFLTFSNQPSKNYGDPDVYENSHLETQPVVSAKQLKNSREKRDRPDSSDKNGKLATSYV